MNNNDAALKHMAKASAELALFYQMNRVANEHLKTARRELKAANETSINKDCPTYKRLATAIDGEMDRLNLEFGAIQDILTRAPLANMVLEGSKFIKDVFV